MYSLQSAVLRSRFEQLQHLFVDIPVNLPTQRLYSAAAHLAGDPPQSDPAANLSRYWDRSPVVTDLIHGTASIRFEIDMQYPRDSRDN